MPTWKCSFSEKNLPIFKQDEKLSKWHWTSDHHSQLALGQGREEKLKATTYHQLEDSVLCVVVVGVKKNSTSVAKQQFCSSYRVVLYCPDPLNFRI